MDLATQRKDLLPAALAARPRGRAEELAGPSDTDIARLSDTVDQLEIKSENLAQDVRQAQGELEKRESQLHKARRALKKLAAPAASAEAAAAAAQQGLVRRERAAQAQREIQDALAALPGPVATPPEAGPLRDAKQQLAQAQHQVKVAESRFEKVKGATQQKQQMARDRAANSARVAQLARTHEGLLHGMANKCNVDSRTALEELGLPPVQKRAGLTGHKASLQQEFQVYLAGLTERGPDGRCRFRAAVNPGLSKLMAFDALVRTSLVAPTVPIALTACNAYKAAYPGPDNPGLEKVRVMAKLGLDRLSAGSDLLTMDQVVHANGRQKADKLARQSGVSATDAKLVQELRKKDIAGLSAQVRMVQELLLDNREELENTLARFLAAGLMGLQSEHTRYLGDAEAARQEANLRDPDLAARLTEVVQARTALKLAEAQVRALEPPRRDPPGRSAAAALPAAAAAPPVQDAWQGPGPVQDPEIRIATQRGRILELEAARDLARQCHGDVSGALRQTEQALHEARERLDAAWTIYAQWRQAAQRDLAQQRALQGARGVRLAELDEQIKAARAALHADPALRSLIDPWALQRVIEIHVDADDEAVRRRALQVTGLNGRYDSLEHMAQAVADVHEQALRQFPQLFAAQTEMQFQQAARQHPQYNIASKTIVNVSHDHGRLVGQGYDAKPDRTSRLIPLTRSEYGLAWREGRVVISHLHPGVPRRVLRTLAPALAEA